MNRSSPAGGQYLYSWGIRGLPGLGWLICGLVVMALLPAQLKYGVPPWKADDMAGIRPLLASMLVASLLAALLADRQRDASGAVRWVPALAITGVVYLPALLYLILRAPEYPRSIPLLVIAIGSLVGVVPLLLGRRRLNWLACAAAAVAAVLLGTGLFVKSTAEWDIAHLAKGLQKQEASVQALPTALYPLRVASFRGYLDGKVAGGGIAVLGDGYLVATGEGALFHVKRNPSAGSLQSTRLEVSVPIDFDAFFKETKQPDAQPTWFRVTDLLVEEKAGSVTLFAAHNYWKHDEQCTVLRVSMLSAQTRDLVGNRPVGEWKSIYDAGPCQKFANEGQGGRLVRLPDGRLLLSTGVQGGNDSAQNPADNYGKTVAINVATGQGQNFTSGHRNPQGLAVASNGDIWLTEHGPNGGDELDRLVPGGNFGWPLVSYGLPYEPGKPPFNDTPGTHEGFDKPAFSWVPSIGISNLIEVNGGLFPQWQHDLLIASLVRTTLWRARMVDHRVEYVEEIKLDRRIRDLVEDPAGRIVLWTDDHSLIFIEPLQDGAGAGDSNEALLSGVAFSKCTVCHVTTAGANNGIGPNLFGVMGRPVAGAAGYGYTKALSAAGGVWNEERLDRFLADPQAFAPGARLEMQPVPDAAERRRIIAWLMTLH